MFKIKFKEKFAVGVNTVFGIGSILAGSLLLCLPANAGAQSLLDPYADVSPTKESKPFSKKLVKQPIKQPARQSESSLEEPSISSSETNKDLSGAENPENRANGQGVKTNVSKAENNGFLSGIKDVQRGCVNTMKAAGSGIVGGTKAAGSKVAAGTKAIGAGIAAAGQKAISGPRALASNVIPEKKVKKPAQVATANAASPTRTILPPLPGKPLDQVIAQQKELKHAKDTAVTGETKKPGVITSAVGKLSFFHKTKKSHQLILPLIIQTI